MWGKSDKIFTSIIVIIELDPVKEFRQEFEDDEIKPVLVERNPPIIFQETIGQ